MKKAPYLMLLLSCAIILVGCEEDPNQEVIDAIPVVIDDSLFAVYYDWTTNTALIPQDELAIEKAEIMGNTLQLNASYFGGCKQHEFSLIFSTINTESIPPAIFSIFIQDDKEDTCRAVMIKEVIFDLSPIKERFWYLEKYSGFIEIMIRIPSSDVAYPALRYKFE